jgi:hypothetical protein
MHTSDAREAGQALMGADAEQLGEAAVAARKSRR